ncbi:DUF3592 domain-containing protein [Luteimonas aquatica]|uniref:DUF3592 domain-containing protein n=1 Tax=Luteimonas aquatica TaxID=450364 RepID=UPI001F5AF23B|nr:DUF3592 domain-containing protein [Luteimonas aquatica]
MQIVFGIVFALTGLGFLFLFAREALRHADAGMRAQGTVEAVDDVAVGDGLYAVRIGYRDARGRHMSGTGEARTRRPRVGEQVRIRYNPNTPDTVFLDGNRPGLVMSLLMSAFFLALGIHIALDGIHRPLSG